MKRLVEIQHQEGEHLLYLTERTTRDAATMRTIGKITFLYLPATFVAVSLF